MDAAVINALLEFLQRKNSKLKISRVADF